MLIALANSRAFVWMASSAVAMIAETDLFIVLLLAFFVLIIIFRDFSLVFIGVKPTLLDLIALLPHRIILIWQFMNFIIQL